MSGDVKEPVEIIGPSPVRKRVMIRDAYSPDPSLSSHNIETVKEKVSLGAICPLGADREAGVFLLYLLGDDIESVSFKSGIPKDMIIATADRYEWEKKKLLFEGKESDTVKGLQKNIASMILASTYVAVKKEMEQVLAGTMEPKDSTFIPSTLAGIQRLVELFNSIKGLVPLDGTVPSGSTMIQAQNVQVVNNPPVETSEAKELSAKERSEFLKALAQGVKR